MKRTFFLQAFADESHHKIEQHRAAHTDSGQRPPAHGSHDAIAQNVLAGQVKSLDGRLGAKKPITGGESSGGMI